MDKKSADKPTLTLVAKNATSAPRRLPPSKEMVNFHENVKKLVQDNDASQMRCGAFVLATTDDDLGLLCGFMNVEQGILLLGALDALRAKILEALDR